MLEKQRNTLIKKAFETAKIIAPGTELTALEIDDAAYTLNCMLQGWSNEGFRLFNMKTGYMPFLPNKNDYKLSTEAYTEFGQLDLVSLKNIGATKVKVSSVKDMAPMNPVVFLNNTLSKTNKISSIDYDNGVIVLDNPVDMSVFSGDDLFFGNVKIATVEVKQYVSGFSSIVLNDYQSLPVVGDYLYLNYSGAWTKVSVSNVDSSNNTVYFVPSLGAGRISKPQVIFGSLIGRSSVLETAEVLPRKLNTTVSDFIPNTVSLLARDGLSASGVVERVDEDGIVLESPISGDFVKSMGSSFIDANETYKSSSLLKWYQIPSDVVNDVIDWGSVNEVPHDANLDFGFVGGIVSGESDFGTLSGSAKIIGYAKDSSDTYVSIVSDGTGFLLCKTSLGEWIPVDEGQEAKLLANSGNVYAYNIDGGLYSLVASSANLIYSGFFVEHIVSFDGAYYLVSEETASGRLLVKTKDFLVFESPYPVNKDIDFTNAVEFKGKLYCGKNKTFVSSDMKSFYDASVYSENRGIVGNVLQNFNKGAICSYTVDGVNFVTIPATTASVSTSFSIHGCSFISVYGRITQDGAIGSQVFSVNKYGDVWYPQAVLSGKVFDIYESDGEIIIVSDTEVQTLKVSIDTKNEHADLYAFGAPIGRPQEVMNVVKYGLNSSVQISMEEMSLKDYSQLPHVKADGDPVTYCFFRDAKDGKMMIWGTPKKFGEYLKFTYVEPIALLDNAKSVPDIPDEYVGAVIDGLAAQLAYEYALPVDKTQMLEAKAEASKQIALLHDNENTSYVIQPNRRDL